jgi:hypothetical protein
MTEATGFSLPELVITPLREAEDAAYRAGAAR